MAYTTCTKCGRKWRPAIMLASRVQACSRCEPFAPEDRTSDKIPLKKSPKNKRSRKRAKK